MSPISRLRWRESAIIALTLALVFALSPTLLAFAAEQLIQLSSDPYTNKTSQHKTQVEPDTFAFGNTIVSAFQSGRFFNGGGSNIGWATSNNAGETWTHGFLPGTTIYATPPGPDKYHRVSDASVAYDARHKVWIISYLAFLNGVSVPTDVLVSRSTDGGRTWGLPVPVNTSGASNDKNWSVCDDTASSPFYGNCYTEWDNFSNNNLVQMSTSKDGGKTWGPTKTTADHASVIGGQPLVQPGGKVIVPITVFTAHSAYIGAFTSTNGGASWNSTVKVASLLTFTEKANIRSGGVLPSAEIDRSGRVYVVWQDCRFEKGCSANDIVISTSTDGVHWSQAQRVPIDPVGSGVDHQIPGLGVDRSTSGDSAHLGLAYYYFPHANCTTDTCNLDVGFISSTNGGASWSQAEQLAGPMKLTWLALTSQGRMVGDYISTSIVPGDDDATPVFAVAQPPTGGTSCNVPPVVCHEATYTTPEDLLPLVGGTNPLSSSPVFSGPQSAPLVRITR